jgi:hypothetical protein
MNAIPNFEDALKSYGRFLGEHGHPTEIVWVFREDIWKRSLTSVALRFPSQTKNLVLAKKVFEEGREKGLVEIKAIASLGDKVAATVWFPRFKEEAIQGWDCGMKLVIASPLPSGEIVGHLKWLSFRLSPKFRHYQRFDVWVGTKAWAAAQQAFGADSP